MMQRFYPCLKTFWSFLYLTDFSFEVRFEYIKQWPDTYYILLPSYFKKLNYTDNRLIIQHDRRTWEKSYWLF